MSTHQSINLRYLAGKLESAPGTMETPTDADFNVRCKEIAISPAIGIDDENQKYARGDHGEQESIIGAQSVEITFRCKAAWGGAVGIQPEWWKFAQACGLKPITYGVAGVALVARKEYDVKTITIWVADVERGSTPVTTFYKCAGCMGNMTISAEGIGAPWMIDFRFMGKLVDVADGTALTLTAPQTTVAEKFLSNTFTINAAAAKISSFSFDQGNDIQPVINQAEATGYSHYGIVARRPRFSCNPLGVKQATNDWLDRLLNQTNGVISLASSRFTLKGLKAQQLSTAIANREGLVNWDQNYKLLANGFTGALADSDLTAEDTFEFLQGARA